MSQIDRAEEDTVAFTVEDGIAWVKFNRPEKRNCMSPKLNRQMLRVLEGHPFRRVGGEKELSSDARLICATNRNLAQRVQDGLFRADLYYRLRVFEIALPPLRERRADIPELARHFVHKLAPRANPGVTAIAEDAIVRLLAYSWPGNVRELENAIEQALVFAEGSVITAAALPAHIRGEDRKAAPEGPAVLPLPGGQLPLPEILDDLERQLILKAYREAKGVKTETARLLGIKPSALYYKLDKYRIE